MDDLISRQAAIMDAESWVAVDEYEKHLQKKVVEWLKEFTPAKLGTNLAEVGTDCISRRRAIDAVVDELDVMDAPQWAYDSLEGRLKQLPPAQPEQHIDEWCYSCKEYDKEKHCCPRWNKVIRQTLADAQLEQHIDADGTLWITVPDIKQVKRVIVDEEKSKFCRQFYMDAQPEPCEDAVSRTEILRMINCINDHHAITPYKSVGAVTEHLTRIASNLPPVTPKQRTGKWIKGHCSECGDHAPYWSMSSAYYGSKFCPNCGAKMEGDAE